MFTSIWDDIKREFSYGNMVTRIIIVNIAFFVAINLLYLVLFITAGWKEANIYKEVLYFFSLSGNWKYQLTHPWTVITSMFLHEGFFHLLWNMLFLYWFGRIVGDFIGNQRVLPIYLLGGLVGGAAYFLSANLLPEHVGIGTVAYGASAAVMAIVVAAGAIAPNYQFHLFLIGEVKL